MLLGDKVVIGGRATPRAAYQDRVVKQVAEHVADGARRHSAFVERLGRQHGRNVWRTVAVAKLNQKRTVCVCVGRDKRRTHETAGTMDATAAAADAAKSANDVDEADDVSPTSVGVAPNVAGGVMPAAVGAAASAALPDTEADALDGPAVAAAAAAAAADANAVDTTSTSKPPTTPCELSASGCTCAAVSASYAMTTTTTT